MRSPEICVTDLELWRGESQLVRGLSFRAVGGELLHIAGANGVGKTTLLRALAGLTLPESGDICCDDVPVRNDLVRYHRQLAWLGHRDGLRSELSARENLRYQQRISGRPDGAVDAALHDAGLAGQADLQARLLSAGQKRRAALARVFASASPVWILDEPFANLDAEGRRWGLARVREHLDDGGMAIMTTHLKLDHAPVKLIELGAV